jgi:hypothetical protein
MTNPNDAIRPVEMQSFDSHRGLTKREYFAFEFAKILLANDLSDTPIADGIIGADKLIKMLNGDLKK